MKNCEHAVFHFDCDGCLSRLSDLMYKIREYERYNKAMDD